MAINIVCYTSERRDDGTYTVLVNTTEPKNFPTKEDHAKRIVVFENLWVEVGAFYILWSAQTEDNGRKIVAKKVTKIAKPKDTKVVPIDTKIVPTIPEVTPSSYVSSDWQTTQKEHHTPYVVILSDNLKCQINDPEITPAMLNYT